MNKSNKFTIKYITRAQRWYRNYTAALGSFLIAFAAASTFAPVHNSDASQLVNVTNENTGYYVRVSGSDSVAIDVDANPSGQLAGGKDTITTVTNSPRGYQLYISASSDYLYLNGDASSNSKFSPIGGDLTSAITLGIDTWGFALDTSAAGVASNNFAAKDNYASSIPTSSATYASLPTSATMVQSIDSANYPDGTDLDIYYGIKASSNLPTGSYQATITYTALSDGVNNNADYMQDFTADMCSALPTSASGDVHEIELIDKRDMKWYRVAKLADGHCWMVQNLALDGDITLTPKDSNVTKNRHLDANIENGDTSANDKIQIFSGVAETKDTNGSKYGNLYNFMAATAGVGDENSTGTVYESICPKGWRLPDHSGDYSWSNLMTQYGYSRTATDGAAVQAFLAPPFNIALAGTYYGALVGQGELSTIRSRTISDENNDTAYRYYANNNNGAYNFSNTYYKASAEPVRCVFEGSLDQITYMQDLTISICKSTAEGATASLLDKRGRGNAGSDTTTPYGVLKAKDGNCWMTDNLNLYHKEISYTDSDFTSGTFTIPDTTNWTDATATQPRVHRATNSSYEDQVYYNWSTAVRTINTTNITTQQNMSICPKNWRLPFNGDKDTDKSYVKLLDAYEVTTGKQLVEAATGSDLYNLGFHKYYGFWYANQASEWDQESRSFFWSSTPTSSTSNAYALLYTSSGIELQNSSSKSLGFPIRCVLR